MQNIVTICCKYSNIVKLKFQVAHLSVVQPWMSYHWRFLHMVSQEGNGA